MSGKYVFLFSYFRASMTGDQNNASKRHRLVGKQSTKRPASKVDVAATPSSKRFRISDECQRSAAELQFDTPKPVVLGLWLFRADVQHLSATHGDDLASVGNELIRETTVEEQNALMVAPSTPSDVEEIVCDEYAPAPVPPPQQEILSGNLLVPPRVDLADLLGYSANVVLAEDNTAASLQNLGNTCYLNATLHALARLPALRNWCSQHQQHCQWADGASGICALCDLAWDVAHITVNPDATPMAPRTAQHRSRWNANMFQGNDQEDANEALDILMQACDSVDVRAAEFFGGDALNVHCVETSTRNTTPFWKVFGGIQCSTTKCEHCTSTITTYAIEHALSLSIPMTPTTVERLLANHLSCERLRDREDHCTVCDPHNQHDGRRTKHTEMLRWPRVLLLQLKRWEVISQRPFVRRKNSVRIHFETILPVSPEVPPFHLRAVVVHHGAAGGGHYTSYVNPSNNLWYHCDDRVSPRQCNIREVLNAEAYMLFYEQ